MYLYNAWNGLLWLGLIKVQRHTFTYIRPVISSEPVVFGGDLILFLSKFLALDSFETGLDLAAKAFSFKWIFHEQNCFCVLPSKLEMGFDQLGLMWYVFSPRGLVYS